MAPTNRTPNAVLRDAIFRSGKRQIEIADRVGIHESRLSKILHGRAEPTDAEMKAIAKVLKQAPEALFPQLAAAS